MHRGTCVKHVPWCMPGSLTNGFLWNRRLGKRSRHSRRTRNLQFCVSGKRPMIRPIELPRICVSVSRARDNWASFNPLRGIFPREFKRIFTFHVIAPQWHGIGSWNLSSCKTRTYLFYKVNVMVADDLATQRARTSSTMTFIMLNSVNLVPTR